MCIGLGKETHVQPSKNRHDPYKKTLFTHAILFPSCHECWQKMVKSDWILSLGLFLGEGFSGPQTGGGMLWWQGGGAKCSKSKRNVSKIFFWLVWVFPWTKGKLSPFSMGVGKLHVSFLSVGNLHVSFLSVGNLQVRDIVGNLTAEVFLVGNLTPSPFSVYFLPWVEFWNTSFCASLLLRPSSPSRSQRRSEESGTRRRRRLRRESKVRENREGWRRKEKVS